MCERVLQNVGSVYSSVKVLRLMRVVRVARTLDQYIEYGAAVLILLVFMFVLIAHWLACVWYTIGDYELSDAVQFGWLSALVRVTSDCPEHLPTHQLSDLTRRHEADNVSTATLPRPSVAMSYLTSLYYTMSCITSVGFGNVSATTQYEKIFSICTMILGGGYTLLLACHRSFVRQHYSFTRR